MRYISLVLFMFTLLLFSCGKEECDSCLELKTIYNHSTDEILGLAEEGPFIFCGSRLEALLDVDVKTEIMYDPETQIVLRIETVYDCD